MKPGKDSSAVKSPGTVDWREIHRRLEAVREAVEQRQTPSPAQTREVLRARARMLARKPETDWAQADAIEVVEFVVAYEKYAVDSRYVREVFPLNDLTPVPGTQAHVLGIINVRGQILFVIDIKKFFDLPAKGLTDLNKIVILRSETAEFGILADQIVGMRSIARSELQESLPTLTGIREDYLKGVSSDRSVVLDAGRLLSDPNILVQKAPTWNAPTPKL